MGINMEMCISGLIMILAIIGLGFLILKIIHFSIFLKENFEEIQSLRTDLKYFDKRHENLRDDYRKLRHEIDALKKVNGGP